MKKRLIVVLGLVVGLVLACDGSSTAGISQSPAPAGSVQVAATVSPASSPATQPVVGSAPVPTSTSDPMAPTAAATPAPTIALPSGRIVFGASRGGNEDVVLIDLNAAKGDCHFIETRRMGETTWAIYEPMERLKMVNLTDHPAVDWWPRWLPGCEAISFSSNRSGEPIVDPDSGEERRRPQWYLMGPDGSGMALLTVLGPHGALPTWSPDGRQIAYVVSVMWEDPEIWVTNQDGSDRRLLARGYDPQWSPAGDWIAFLRYPHGPDDRRDSELYLIHPDGSDEHLLLQNRHPISEIVWSPDGLRIAFISFGDIYVVEVGEGRVQIWDINFGGGACTGWSPDGDWLACDFKGDIYAVNLERRWVIRLTRHEPGDLDSYLFPHWGT